MHTKWSKGANTKKGSCTLQQADLYLWFVYISNDYAQYKIYSINSIKYSCRLCECKSATDHNKEISADSANAGQLMDMSNAVMPTQNYFCYIKQLSFEF